MRIASSTFFSNTNLVLQQRQLELARVQEEIATGRKVLNLGKDPVAARNMLQQQGRLRHLDSRRSSMQTADMLLSTSDGVLHSIQEAVKTVYEKAVQLGNDSYSLQDRQFGANLVAEIREHILDLANTEVNGRFIFGGLDNNNAPYDALGAFNGDNGQVVVSLGSVDPAGNLKVVEATVEGGQPFEDPAGVGPNLFGIIDNLVAELNANDGPGIQALIGDLRDGLDRVLSARQSVGTFQVKIQGVQDADDLSEAASQALLSQAGDTDPLEAVQRLRETQTSFQAAMVLASRLEGLNLVNFI
ncbi:MAG: hypothetical protein CMH54_00545 [Myxococcales bacterium]|nr:hypothetical protein [Myxococcales bacterium]|tara:strand:- start:2787 stop:3689 length:903 start_codon:yes stop_codon:yes gene_type:complete